MALIPGQKLIIGVSAAGGSSQKLTKMLYQFNRRTMKRSVYFMMGGTEAKRIASQPEKIRWFRCYKRIYVETEGMLRSLVEVGLDNARLFPNCRVRPKQTVVSSKNDSDVLRCVFFSLIQPEKGTDLILEAASALENVRFSFYGHISEEYKEGFLKKVDESDNVEYNGIFGGTNEEIYRELAKYDVLLFPTQWKTEGVPGILVEAKIAGLACVVSDMSYNSELVADGTEGLVMRRNDAETLRRKILLLDQNRDLLRKLKKGSAESGERFFIDKYIDEIVDAVCED